MNLYLRASEGKSLSLNTKDHANHLCWREKHTFLEHCKQTVDTSVTRCDKKEVEQCSSIKHTASIILRMNQWVRMRCVPLNAGEATHTHLSSAQLQAILRE